MSAEDAFSEFDQFRKVPTRAHVLIATEDEEENIHFQRLTLTDAVSEEFKSDAFQAFAVSDNVRCSDYEAGYKPDDDELCCLRSDGSDLVKDVVANTAEAAHNFNRVGLFIGDDETIESLRFYVVVVESTTANDPPSALFFRSFRPTNELARSGWKALVQEGDYFNRINKKIFTFDSNVDCLVWQRYIFVKNITEFQRIFDYYEKLQAQARQTIAMVAPRLPIQNLPEFTGACMNNPYMLSKLTEISKKPYLSTMTIEDIKLTIKEFGLDVPIMSVNGKEMLVWETSPKKRWLILKLLDDDYLGSTMTKLRYASTSKTQMK